MELHLNIYWETQPMVNVREVLTLCMFIFIPGPSNDGCPIDYPALLMGLRWAPEVLGQLLGILWAVGKFQLRAAWSSSPFCRLVRLKQPPAISRQAM